MKVIEKIVVRKIGYYDNKYYFCSTSIKHYSDMKTKFNQKSNSTIINLSKRLERVEAQQTRIISLLNMVRVQLNNRGSNGFVEAIDNLEKATQNLLSARNKVESNISTSN